MFALRGLLACVMAGSWTASGCRRGVLDGQAVAAPQVAASAGSAAPSKASPGSPPGSTVASAPVIPARLPPHPRVWLTPERVGALKSRAAAGDADWKIVETRARELSSYAVAPFAREGSPARSISYSYQGFGWLNAVVPLGLAHQVTGEARYAAKLRELLVQINALTAAGDLSPISIDSGYPSRTAALAVALIYDWAYPTLDAGLRKATAETMNRWFDWNRTSAFERDGEAYGNYFGGHLLGFGAVGFASLGDNPRAPEIVAHVQRLFDKHVRPAFTEGGFAGGFPVEGYVYGANHFVRLFQYLDLVRTATGGPVPELDDWGARCARNLLHNLKPNRWQVPDEASYAGDFTGVLAADLPRTLAFVLGDRPEGLQMRRLTAQLARPPGEPQKDELGPAHRLMYARGTARRDAPSAPRYFHSPGDERMTVRSGWDDGAVWASLNGGMSLYAGHQAKTAGHVAIQRGNDYLLVYAGQWKGPSGVTGQPQMDVLTSDAANTLFVDDGGRYLMTGDSYRGGQGAFARTRPYPFVQDEDFAWARVDLTDAYDRRADQRNERNRTVRRYHRHFAWMAPGTFVLFDRVETLKPEDRKHVRFHFHHDGPPNAKGRDVTSLVGKSKLAMRVLLPAEPELATGWAVAKDTPLVPRLEVGNRTAAARLDALTVMQALARDQAPAPVNLLRTDSGGMIGARVDDPRGGQVLLFAADPQQTVAPEGAIRYELPPAPQTRHVLVDLRAGVRYAATVAAADGATRITLARSDSGKLVVDERGVLRFLVTDGMAQPLPPPAAGRVVSSR